MPEGSFESFVYDGKMLKDRTREELYTVIEELVHEVERLEAQRARDLEMIYGS